MPPPINVIRLFDLRYVYTDGNKLITNNNNMNVKPVKTR